MIKGEFWQLPQSIAKLPAVYMRAFLTEKTFIISLTRLEERKLDHRVTRLTFLRYCLLLSSIKGGYFNIIMGTYMTSYLDVLPVSLFKKVTKKVLLSYFQTVI